MDSIKGKLWNHRIEDRTMCMSMYETKPEDFML